MVDSDGIKVCSMHHQLIILSIKKTINNNFKVTSTGFNKDKIKKHNTKQCKKQIKTKKELELL